jgi:hypothetical protein
MVLYVLIWDLGRTLESTRSEVKWQQAFSEYTLLSLSRI